MDKKDAMEKIAKRLTTQAELKGVNWIIKSACMVATLNRRDQYKTEGLLGGEIFKFSSVYVGKSAKLIFCFAPSKPKTYKRVEFDENKLKEALPDFVEKLEEILESDIGTYLKNYLGFHEKEKIAADLAKHQEIYGQDWGIFL